MTWAIMVSRGVSGRPYLSVVDASMLPRRKNTQTLPTWHVVDVPPALSDLAPEEILRACHAAIT